MKNPLRLKELISGTLRLQGVFRMYDELGFPISMTFDIAKEKGWEIDWIEALADALRSDIFKYDLLLKEIEMLGEDVAVIKRMFPAFLMDCEGPTASDKAQHLYSKFREDKDGVSKYITVSPEFEPHINKEDE